SALGAAETTAAASSPYELQPARAKAQPPAATAKAARRVGSSAPLSGSVVISSFATKVYLRSVCGLVRPCIRTRRRPGSGGASELDAHGGEEPVGRREPQGDE